MRSRQEKNRGHLVTGLALLIVLPLYAALRWFGSFTAVELWAAGLCLVLILAIRTALIEVGPSSPAIHRQLIRTAIMAGMIIALIGQSVIISRNRAEIRQKDQIIESFRGQLEQMKKDIVQIEARLAPAGTRPAP